MPDMGGHYRVGVRFGRLPREVRGELQALLNKIYSR
jgi:hypothetical protein